MEYIIWKEVEEKIAIHFVTSWATTKEACLELIKAIQKIISK